MKGPPMKALLIALAIAAPAAAQPTFLGEDDLGKLYLLEISQHASATRVWMLRDIDPAHPAFRDKADRSAKILIELNCSEAMARHTFTYFSQPQAGGAVLGGSQGMWGPIAPGSMARRAHRIACR